MIVCRNKTTQFLGALTPLIKDKDCRDTMLIMSAPSNYPVYRNRAFLLTICGHYADAYVCVIEIEKIIVVRMLHTYAAAQLCRIKLLSIIFRSTYAHKQFQWNL